MALVTGVLVTIPDSDEDSRHYLSEFLDALVEALSEEAAERSAQELATNRHSAGLSPSATPKTKNVRLPLTGVDPLGNHLQLMGCTSSPSSSATHELHVCL